MTLHEVWMEGYAFNGERGGATFVGEVEADSFHEACMKLCGSDPNFNEERLTVWGCGLYSNEGAARRSFG